MSKLISTKTKSGTTHPRENGPYCPRCGKREVSRLTGYYDRKTGKPTRSYKCETSGCVYNAICRPGCHEYGLFSNECTKCGKPSAEI